MPVKKDPWFALQPYWRITYQRRPSDTPRDVSKQIPGAGALIAFFDTCDKGKGGYYELLGMSAQKQVVLATATVDAKNQSMDISWKQEWIFFSLGAKGMHGEVDGVVTFFCDGLGSK